MFLKTQFLPQSKHFISVMKTSQFMLCMEKVAVCSEIHIKHINALFGQNVEFFNVKPCGAQSNR
jgi:hypothetical protein